MPPVAVVRSGADLEVIDAHLLPHAHEHVAHDLAAMPLACRANEQTSKRTSNRIEYTE
jgi:hypothetical protein